MARFLKEHLIARSQQDGAEEHKRDPQQEDQPDTTVGEDIEDYNLDVDYDRSEPKVE